MPDYKEMYNKLIRAQNKAIKVIQEAHQETEEMYISSPEPSLTVLPDAKGDDNDEDTD